MTRTRTTDPALFVIFGGGGDLAWRKLVPALYNLLARRPPARAAFAILGVDLKAQDDAAYRDHLREGVDQFSRRGPATTRTGRSLPPKSATLPAIYQRCRRPGPRRASRKT